MKKTYIAPETSIFRAEMQNMLAESMAIDAGITGDEMYTKEHTPAPSWNSGSVWNEW